LIRRRIPAANIGRRKLMKPATQRRSRRIPEEEAYGRFAEVFDLDVFALELEYGDRVGAVIREGVEKALDRRQRDFEAVLAAHPATAAEESCRALARQLEEGRLKEAAKRKGGVGRARWRHAKLASARAS
jgi:hypothetical protein